MIIIVSYRSDFIVPQRLIESSWASNTLTMNDSLELRYKNGSEHNFEADAKYPLPLIVTFSPARSVRYSSRFRFTCEYGNNFDILLEGDGTYEEHEHKPISPIPR